MYTNTTSRKSVLSDSSKLLRLKSSNSPRIAKRANSKSKLRPAHASAAVKENQIPASHVRQAANGTKSSVFKIQQPAIARPDAVVRQRSSKAPLRVRTGNSPDTSDLPSTSGHSKSKSLGTQAQVEKEIASAAPVAHRPGKLEELNKRFQDALKKEVKLEAEWQQAKDARPPEGLAEDKELEIFATLRGACSKAKENLDEAHGALRDLNRVIGFFEEEQRLLLEHERRKLELSLARTQDGSKAQSLQDKLRDLREQSKEIGAARVERETALNADRAKIVANSPGHQRAASNWPLINIRLEDSSSQPLYFARLELATAVHKGDVSKGLLGFVQKFGKACQSERTEVDPLLELIEQSKTDPLKKEVLALLSEGVHLSMGPECDKGIIALQHTLDIISVLLQLIVAEPAGAKIYAAMMEKHHRNMDDAIVRPLLVIETVGMEPDESRNQSFKRFLGQYADYGTRLREGKFACPAGASRAFQVLPHITKFERQTKEAIRRQAQLQETAQ